MSQSPKPISTNPVWYILALLAAAGIVLAGVTLFSGGGSTGGITKVTPTPCVTSLCGTPAPPPTKTTSLVPTPPTQATHRPTRTPTNPPTKPTRTPTFVPPVDTVPPVLTGVPSVPPIPTEVPTALITVPVPIGTKGTK